MAPKSAPFKIVVHYTGKKTKTEMQELYANFYINSVRNTLMSRNLSEEGKKDVLNRLVVHYNEADLAA